MAVEKDKKLPVSVIFFSYFTVYLQQLKWMPRFKMVCERGTICRKKKRIRKGYLFWYVKELGVEASTYKILLSTPLPWVEKLTFPALAAFFRVNTGLLAVCFIYRMFELCYWREHYGSGKRENRN